MEETKTTTAIILSRHDYRESDSLVSVYTPHEGRLNLLARGTKKQKSKLAGHIEPLTRADVMIIRGKGFDYLGSAITQDSYHGIREDLNKLYYAGQAMRLYLRQTEENPGDERLFDLLAEGLKVLDSHSVSGAQEFSKETGELFLAALIWKFLAETGHQPELKACLSCRRPVQPGGNHFDLSAGGLICPECYTKNKEESSPAGRLLTISDNCVKLLRFILENDLAQTMKIKADKRSVKELASLVNNFLNFVR